MSITPPRSPYWYDEYWAFDHNTLKVLPPTAYSLAKPGHDVDLRKWANDPRTFKQFRDEINRYPDKWPQTYPPFANSEGSNSPPFLPSRGPAPKWFTSCITSDNRETKNFGRTEPSISNTGFLCDYLKSESSIIESTTGRRGSGPPTWAMVYPVYDKQFPIGWRTVEASGIVTNSFLSGHDGEPVHRSWPGQDIEDLPRPEDQPQLLSSLGYWLGVSTPYYYTGWGETEGNCDYVNGIFDAAGQLCNDWNGHVLLDPKYNNLRSTAKDAINPSEDIEKGNLVLEIEQWMVPNGYRPEPGDRIYTAGRLISDCGEMKKEIVGYVNIFGERVPIWKAKDTHTEIHPVELLVSSYLQLAPPERNFGNCVGVFDPCTKNSPPVIFQWQNLIGDRPATVNKVVTTAFWQGGTLTFNLWPPPKPDMNSELHWFNGFDRKEGDIGYTITPVPEDNPNHLRIEITAPVREMHFDWSYEDGGFRSEGSPCFYPGPPAYRSIYFGDPDPGFCTLWGSIEPYTDRRIVDSILLWWQ